MSSSKSKSLKNILYSLLGQLITISLGLIVPRMILLNYGSEANGLTSSATQIFAYVALLEAGVGGATLQALYKPMGNNDQNKVSSILAATNSYYRKTGILYAIVVLLLAVCYPVVVKSEYDFWTVFGVIFFNGMGGAINFFFQGKYHLLLQAEGKNYIKMNLTTIVYVLSSVLKIVLVYCGFGIVALQAAFFSMNVLQMAYMMIYIRHNYKWIDLSVKPNFQAISQKNSVMIHQLSALVFGNTDSIILTFFCGLKVVSVYSIITTLITHVNSLMNNVSGGVLFSLGQNFHNNRGKFDILYAAFEMLYYAMMAFCLAMIYIFLNPFLSLYTRGVTDIPYVDKYLPFLFVCSYYLTWARVPSVYVINNCAGHFRQTQTRSIIESTINIVVSIVSVFHWGIYGVLIGTIIALLYRTNDMIIYSAKYILNRSFWDSYSRLMINTIWLVGAILIGKFLLPELNGYIPLFIYAGLYAASLGVSIIVINYLTDKKTFQYILRMIIKNER